MIIEENKITSILNQVFEMEKKVQGTSLEKSLHRNLNRIKMPLEEMGYKSHNPIGEAYDLTRLDCEAMVAGEGADQLRIVEVIKPIIYFQENGNNTLIQKAVVITETS